MNSSWKAVCKIGDVTHPSQEFYKNESTYVKVNEPPYLPKIFLGEECDNDWLITTVGANSILTVMAKYCKR